MKGQVLAKLVMLTDKAQGWNVKFMEATPSTISPHLPASKPPPTHPLHKRAKNWGGAINLLTSYD